MMNNKLLIIGLIWPEPDATAAGTRMMQLIDLFIKQGYDLTFASAALKNPLSFDFSETTVSCIDIELNSDSFDVFLKELNPGIVLFDRFITEEQYGWRVREISPKAIRILDTEDLHFLRKSREIALKQGVDDWMNFVQNDITKREIASIYRCDLSLIISAFEHNLLTETFHIDASLIFYLPFLIEGPFDENFMELPGYNQRSDFMTIGNFKHQPNLDAVRYLHADIWPLIRKECPRAKLHIYGAYVPESMKQLHNKSNGFLIEGWIDSKEKAFINSRICLAPLRFGAGQKGKLLDAMVFGTPSITSTVGAEGMMTSEIWNGFVEDDAKAFASKAVKLFQDKTLWTKAQQTGFSLLKKNHDKMFFETLFIKRLLLLIKEIEKHRKLNFTGSMLSHHQHQSTKYLSKWIEAKNLLNDKIVE